MRNWGTRIVRGYRVPVFLVTLLLFICEQRFLLFYRRTEGVSEAAARPGSLCHHTISLVKITCALKQA